MNERIKQLAEQAGDYAITQVNTDECDSCGECVQCINWLDVYNSKFAELLVLSVLDKVGQRWSEGDIKQHFGVEE